MSTVSMHPGLSREQREAVQQMASSRDTETIAGFASTGKSAVLAGAKDEWEPSGRPRTQNL
jgi:AAA domain